MKSITVLFLMQVLLYSSCTNSKSHTESSTKEDVQSNLSLEISEQGIFLNSKKITPSTNYSDVKSIIGEPSKEKIPTATEIETTKQKFGGAPNNIYTYDNYGVLIYQAVDRKEINTISIDFKKQDYKFSPTTAFSGTVKLNDIAIDKNTSLTDLKKIAGLTINESLIKVNNAKYNNHDITFVFNNPSDKSELVGFAIEVNNISEPTNEKGWTEKELDILKASMKNAERVKELSIQFNFKISDLVNCYATKVSTTITKSELENPSMEIQNKSIKIVEDCIIEITQK